MGYRHPPRLAVLASLVLSRAQHALVDSSRPASVSRTGTNPTTSLCFAQRLRDILTTFQSFVDSRDELTAGIDFEDVAKGPGLEGRLDDLEIRVNRQENDCGSALVFLELAGDLDAGELRHGDIEDNDIRLECTGRLEGGGSVFHGPHELEVRFQKRSHGSEQLDAIVTPENTLHKFFPMTRVDSHPGCHVLELTLRRVVSESV